MTRLSLVFVAFILPIVLSPAAHAYSTEPTMTVIQASATRPQVVVDGEVCVRTLSPELARALALPEMDQENQSINTACAVTE